MCIWAKTSLYAIRAIKVSVYNYEAPLVPIELILRILLDRQKKLLKRENKAKSIS